MYMTCKEQELRLWSWFRCYWLLLHYTVKGGERKDEGKEGSKQKGVHMSSCELGVGTKASRIELP